MHISRYFYGPRCDTLLKAPFPLRKKTVSFPLQSLARELSPYQTSALMKFDPNCCWGCRERGGHPTNS